MKLIEQAFRHRKTIYTQLYASDQPELRNTENRAHVLFDRNYILQWEYIFHLNFFKPY